MIDAPPPAPVLNVRDLQMHYTLRQGFQSRVLKAVDGVSLTLKAGECLGLEGESGCGKTSLAQAIIGIVTPTCGSVEIAGVTADPSRPIGGRARARAIRMVFQDPYWVCICWARSRGRSHRQHGPAFGPDHNRDERSKAG